jgi:chromosome segregation ATPase
VELPGVEVSEITAVRTSLARRLARPLRERSGPPSLRAQLVLMLAAMLLGAVLAGLLFVGVWRHTATEGDAARAAQLATKQQLRTAQIQLKSARAQLVTASAATRHVRAQLHVAQAQGAALRKQNTRAAARLAAPVGSLVASGASLQHQLSKLSSELSTIQTYLTAATATGVDPAFISAQVKYLQTSAGAAEQAASALAQQAARAQAAAKQLTSSHSR